MSYKKLVRFIGIAIVIYIISRLDYSTIYETFKKTDKLYLIIGLTMTIFSALAKAVRWNYLKKAQNIKYGISDSFVMYCASHLAGTITPGRIGELSKAIYLKNDGYSYGQSIFSVILDRIFDIFFLIFFAGIGTLFFNKIFQNEIPYIIFLMTLLALLIILIKKTLLLEKSMRFLADNTAPKKYADSWQKNIADFIKDLNNLSLKNLSITLFLTIIAWLIYYVQMFILAKSIGISMPFIFLSISVTIAGILTMIPISYLGIGIRDITLITLFSFYSIPKETAVAFSGLILMTCLIMAIVGFYCFLLKTPNYKK